jgi:hypothetical protein
VRLYGPDINTARSNGLIVQQSACDKHVFWDDEHTQKKNELKRKNESLEALEDMVYAGEAFESSLGDGFCGIEDADLFQTALASYKNAKRAALQQQRQQQKTCNTSNQKDTHDMDTMSYVSLNDHVVFNRLQNVGWDQRNGHVNLLPLCVYTNGV